MQLPEETKTIRKRVKFSQYGITNYFSRELGLYLVIKTVWKCRGSDAATILYLTADWLFNRYVLKLYGNYGSADYNFHKKMKWTLVPYNRWAIECKKWIKEANSCKIKVNKWIQIKLKLWILFGQYKQTIMTSRWSHVVKNLWYAWYALNVGDIFFFLKKKKKKFTEIQNK